MNERAVELEQRYSVAAVTFERLLPRVWRIDRAGTPEVKLRAGVVADVEALCRGVIRELTAAKQMSDADELLTLSHLFETVLIKTPKYDPGRAGILFRPWLHTAMQRAAIDFWRTFHGRKGEKRVADDRLLQSARRDSGLLDDRDHGVDRSDRPAEEGPDGTPGDRAFPREWADLPGDRPFVVAAPVGGLGRDEGVGDPGCVGGGGVEAGGRDVGAAARPDRGAPPFLDCVSCGTRSYAAPPNGIDKWHYPPCAACGAVLEPCPTYPMELILDA